MHCGQIERNNECRHGTLTRTAGLRTCIECTDTHTTLYCGGGVMCSYSRGTKQRIRHRFVCACVHLSVDADITPSPVPARRNAVSCRSRISHRPDRALFVYSALAGKASGGVCLAGRQPTRRLVVSSKQWSVCTRRRCATCPADPQFGAHKRRPPTIRESNMFAATTVALSFLPQP
eukprot:7381657-Prymnesium_polylepis.1